MDLKTSLYLIIPAVVILLLVFPILVEFRVSFNPIYNRGVVALFIFKKKIFYYIVSLHGKYIKLENENETKMQEIEFASPEFEVIEEFGRQIKDKLRLRKCLIHYQIGTGDAYSSALVCGFLNVLIMQFFLYVKSHKPTASLCVYDTVSYNKQACEIAGFLSISVSLFDVAYSYIYSVIITKTK